MRSTHAETGDPGARGEPGALGLRDCLGEPSLLPVPKVFRVFTVARPWRMLFLDWFRLSGKPS